MKELNNKYAVRVSGGYDKCDFAEDATMAFFTTAGGIIGAATSFGVGGYVGAGLGSMVGGWASDILLQDMGCKSAV